MMYIKFIEAISESNVVSKDINIPDHRSATRDSILARYYSNFVLIVPEFKIFAPWERQRKKRSRNFKMSLVTGGYGRVQLRRVNIRFRKKKRSVDEPY